MKLCIFVEVEKYDDVIALTRMVKKWNPSVTHLKTTYHDTRYREKRYHRLMWIKRLVSEHCGYRIAILYRNICRKGYVLSYRTFQKDVQELIINGEIKGEKATAKGGGFTWVLSTME